MEEVKKYGQLQSWELNAAVQRKTKTSEDEEAAAFPRRFDEEESRRRRRRPQVHRPITRMAADNVHNYGGSRCKSLRGGVCMTRYGRQVKKTSSNGVQLTSTHRHYDQALILARQLSRATCMHLRGRKGGKERER